MAFQCPICPKAFSSRASLKQHTGTKYQYAQPHKCRGCHEKFCSQLAMEKHRETQGHYPIFMCYACNRSFGDKYGLAQHKESPPHLRMAKAEVSASVTAAVGYFVDLTPTPVDLSSIANHASTSSDPVADHTASDSNDDDDDSSDDDESSSSEDGYNAGGYRRANKQYEEDYDQGDGDMTLCDSDCGWCGHCFDGINI